MSFDLFAYRELKEIVPDCEDRYDQLERNMKLQDLYLIERFEEKQSEGFVGMMEGFLASLEDELMNFRTIEYKGIRKTEEELINLFYFEISKMHLCSPVWMRSVTTALMNTKHYLDGIFPKKNF